MFKAAPGDRVKLHYIGRLEDGTEFHSTPEDEPVHFFVGKQEIVSGVDNAVVGMVPGEKKEVTVAPEEAYGAWDPSKQETIERQLIPEDVPLKLGHQLEITGENGDVLVVTVKDIQEDSVTLDANHPLAGQTLYFTLHMVEVNKAPTE